MSNRDCESMLKFQDNDSWARVHTYEECNQITLEVADGPHPGSMTIYLKPREALRLALLLFKKWDELDLIKAK